MADNVFTPITTQEALDAIIGDRLKRDREAQRKKFEGWLSPEEAQKLRESVEALTTENEGHKQTIARYETASVKSRIADEVGLDRRLLNRIQGETEEDIRKDAQGLKELFGAPVPVAEPLASTEPQKGPGGVAGAWNDVSGQLRGE